MLPDSQSSRLTTNRGEAAEIPLAFHSLSNRVTFGISNYSPKRFSNLLDALTGTLPQSILDRIVITFDDGYEHLKDVLPPLIAKFRFRPVIFVPTAYIGKSNDWDYGGHLRWFNHLNEADIHGLHQLGVQFGSHGHEHVDLRNLPEESLRYHLQQSKQILESITEAAITQISYPFGRYNERVVRIAKEIGFSKGYTMQFPDMKDTAVTIGRYPVYGCDTSGMVIQKITHGSWYNSLKRFSQTAGILSYGTPLWKKLSGQSR